MGIFNKIASGLKKTKESMVKRIETMLNSFTKIDEELFEQLEELLILADVGVPTSEKICSMLRDRVKEKGITDPSEVKGLLKEIITELLGEDNSLNTNSPLSVILVVGVNGVGKTTTIGKLANNLQSQGKRVILAAGDTYRAAAIEQLEIWAQRADAVIVKHAQGTDPAAVIYDALTAAKSRKADVLICDTAGRLHNKQNLMSELAKISRVIEREGEGCDKEVLLVLDATTGQNGINQAREFKQTSGITGIVLTKLDGTAKGGVVISIRDQIGLPVKYIGVGEKLDDLRPFDPVEFANALFD
ncbi:MAG: signal recognition particle-docking protein FtsY [Oscillospiraceae bacterium]|nr:signal recognition particle-docking protein FtsY [Oscillospiraceae bacterium]